MCLRYCFPNSPFSDRHRASCVSWTLRSAAGDGAGRVADVNAAAVMRVGADEDGEAVHTETDDHSDATWTTLHTREESTPSTCFHIANQMPASQGTTLWAMFTHDPLLHVPPHPNTHMLMLNTKPLGVIRSSHW